MSAPVSYTHTSRERETTPIRAVYLHRTCRGQTAMSVDFAVRFANARGLDQTWCSRCMAFHPLEEFEWLDGTRLGT